MTRHVPALHSCQAGLAVDIGSLYNGEDQRKVWDVFEKQKLLGTGAFGSVYLAKAKSADGTVVAVKQLPKETVEMDEALAEFKACARVSHPHIMRVFCFFDTESSIYIVSELARGGELNDYIVAHPELNNEHGIANVMSQVVAALIYLHAEGMVHHDIKPPNILATEHRWSRDPTGTTPLVVVGDFGTCQLRKTTGLASHLHVSEANNGAAEEEIPLLGTPEYCGPEVFLGQSGARTDVYALGVTCFELLAGEKPFSVVWDLFGDGDVDEYAEMKDMAVPADMSRLKGISDEGVSLVSRMLAKDFEVRPKAKEVSESAWFAKCASTDSYFSARSTTAAPALPHAELDARSARMAVRAHMCFFAKALLNTMAARLADEVLDREKAIFMRADDVTAADGDATSHDGGLTVAELRALFNSDTGSNPEGAAARRARLNSVVAMLDLDGDGTLTFNEWVAATCDLDPTSSAAAGAAVVSLFEKLDGDGDGSIRIEELRAHFGELSHEHEAALGAFFASLDSDGDGAVNWSEFKSFVERAGGGNAPNNNKPAAQAVPSFIESSFTTKAEYEAWRLTLGS